MDVVNSEPASLASVAMQALGHIGLRTRLPPLVNNTSQGNIISMPLACAATMVFTLLPKRGSGN